MTFTSRTSTSDTGKHAKTGAILLGVGVAVDLIVRVHLRSVRVDARHAELVVFVAGHVRLEKREVVGIARDERQVPDFGFADRPAEVDLAWLGNRRLAGHRDRLGHVADRQADVDDGGLARRQRQSLLLELAKALQFRGDTIPSERQQRRAIDTRFIGDDDTAVAGVDVRDGDADAGQRGARLISDRAFDRAVDRLRLRQRMRDAQRHDAAPQPKTLLTET